MTPAERALNERELADYAVVVSAFAPRARKPRQHQAHPVRPIRITDMLVDGKQYIGPPPAHSHHWRQCCMVVLFVLGLIVVFGPSPFQP